MKSLTLHDKIAQLIFIPFHGAAPNSATREYRQFVRLVRDTHVGGLVLVNWSNGRVVQKARAVRAGGLRQPDAAAGAHPADRHGRFRTRRFHARGRHHGVSARHGLRRHRRSLAGALRRRGHGPRGARAGRAMGVLSRGRRQQQPRQSHHQHPFLRREPRRGGEVRLGFYRRRALRSQESRPHHGQAFSRARRHLRGHARESGLDSSRAWNSCGAWNWCRSRLRFAPEWIR